MKMTTKAALLSTFTIAISASSFAAPPHATIGHVYDLDKVEQMLRREGLLTPTASDGDSSTVDDYIRAVQDNYRSNPDDELYEQSRARDSRILQIMETQGDNTEDQQQSLVASKQSPVLQKDRILAILIDFPDYPKNSVLPEHTDMYYSDYALPHYQDLIFGKHGYAGPKQQTQISMRQYYEQQSGGSYTVEGQVVGWYRAKYPAAYYGKRNGPSNDVKPRALVAEALLAVAADKSINLSWFDQEDRYDQDGDGNLREPDGLIDHIMVFHASVGEEDGGGGLGSDAIWSHRWNLPGVLELPGTTSEVPGNWNGKMAAYDYTIEPIDAAAGVVAHEYGHDLGLPDEYDTGAGNRQGEPVAFWSVMSAGTRGGKIAGTEPVGFSPWAKEFLQASLQGNWLHGKTVDLANLNIKGEYYTLDQAVTKGPNHDVVRINVPDKKSATTQPFAGRFSYYSGKGNDLNNRLSTTVDLTQATSASLKFKVWYEIEDDYDYGRVLVNGAPIPGSITTSNDPNKVGFGHGFMGKSNGWVNAEFDLSAYSGQNIELGINYLTDVGYVLLGFFVDDIEVAVNGSKVAGFDAEIDDPALSFIGFSRNDGSFNSKRYYLAEWRQHAGIDQGLRHLSRNGKDWSYDPGMVLWFVDQSFDNNHVATRPGEGWLSVVDADQNTVFDHTNAPARTRYQVRDAAFSLHQQSPFSLIENNRVLTDTHLQPQNKFMDVNDYTNPDQPQAGVKIPQLGLAISLVDEDECEYNVEDQDNDDEEDEDSCTAVIHLQNYQ